MGVFAAIRNQQNQEKKEEEFRWLLWNFISFQIQSIERERESIMTHSINIVIFSKVFWYQVMPLTAIGVIITITTRICNKTNK